MRESSISAQDRELLRALQALHLQIGVANYTKFLVELASLTNRYRGMKKQ